MWMRSAETIRNYDITAFFAETFDLLDYIEFNNQILLQFELSFDKMNRNNTMLDQVLRIFNNDLGSAEVELWNNHCILIDVLFFKCNQRLVHESDQ